MKAKMLKIAGVKTESAFYKKFPTQEAFMKVHGKEFKKAQMGVEIEKAQNGLMQGPEQAPSNNYYQNNNPFFTTNPGATGLNNPAVAAPQTGGGMAGAMPYMQAGMDVVQGLSMIKGQKNRVKQAKQQAAVTDVQARAAESRDVDTRRQQQDYFGRKRNALMRPINGEELFPVDGVGTNVLAKDGAEIQNTYAPDNLYDDLGYEPLNDSSKVKQFQYGGYMFPTGMTSQQANISQYGDMASNLSNRFINQGGQEDAGSMIGGGIGAGIGTAFGGPIGGAIGKFAGKTIGGLIDTSDKKIAKYNKQTDKNIERITGQAFAQNLQQQNQSYMEDGGYVNPEYNPQLITMFGDHDADDFADYAHKFRAGGHLKSYTAPSERAMETYEDGGEVRTSALNGEVRTTWGGGVKTLSHNPYMPGTGETIQFVGNSHDTYDPKSKQTGIGVKYGQGDQDSYTDYAEYGTEQADANVEVEKEPAAELIDPVTGEKNLTVWGNLKIPNQYIDLLGDPKAKGKKFKNYVGVDLFKQEKKGNKLVEEAMKIANKENATPLEISTAQAKKYGGELILKTAAERKIKAADLQNAINDTAEENGILADDLARGKYKIDKETMFGQAKWGTSIPQAKDGATTTTESTKFPSVEAAKKAGYTNYNAKTKKWEKTITKADGTKTQEAAAVALDAIPKGQKANEATGLYGGVTPEQFEAYKAKNKWFNWSRFDPKNPAHLNEYKKAFNEKAKSIGSASRILDDPDGKPKFGQQYYSANIDEQVKEQPPVTAIEEADIEETVPTEPIPYKRNVLMDIYNQALPYIRKMPNERLDPRQLYGEMYGLSNNQLEPVDAQFYRPQLDVPYDISLQDQRNEVTAQTRAAQRMVGYNPAAQAQIAAQAYEPLNKITGEEFRLNQAMKDRVYSGNRATLNDAQLKNLAIADQQYERQSQARSNTKAITQAALQSIGDKYVQNALENRKERIQSNLYPQYSFDSEGRVINTGQLTQFNIPTVGSKQGTQQQVPVKDASGKVLYYQLEEYDPSADGGVGTPPLVSLSKNGKSIKARNGSIVKSYKNL
jgi:hypothetical protein